MWKRCRKVLFELKTAPPPAVTTPDSGACSSGCDQRLMLYSTLDTQHAPYLPNVFAIVYATAYSVEKTRIYCESDTVSCTLDKRVEGR